MLGEVDWQVPGCRCEDQVVGSADQGVHEDLHCCGGEAMGDDKGLTEVFLIHLTTALHCQLVILLELLLL